MEESLDIIRDAAASIDLQNEESSLDSRRSHLERCMVNLLCDLLTQDPSNAAQQSIQKLTDQHPAFLVALQKALDRLLGVNSPNGSLSFPFFCFMFRLLLTVAFRSKHGRPIRGGEGDQHDR